MTIDLGGGRRKGAVGDWMDRVGKVMWRRVSVDGLIARHIVEDGLDRRKDDGRLYSKAS